MIKNEPSDRQDRRIQRRKMRGMWQSLWDEKARLDALPVYTTRYQHYIADGGEVVDYGFVRRVVAVVAVVLAGLIVLGYSV